MKLLIIAVTFFTMSAKAELNDFDKIPNLKGTTVVLKTDIKLTEVYESALRPHKSFCSFYELVNGTVNQSTSSVFGTHLYAGTVLKVAETRTEKVRAGNILDFIIDGIPAHSPNALAGLKLEYTHSNNIVYQIGFECTSRWGKSFDSFDEVTSDLVNQLNRFFSW